MVELPYQ